MNTILILTAIAAALGVLIFIMGRVLPPESEVLKRTERIADILPGMNCGACGLPGCFAYAQAIAANPNAISDNPCAITMQDPDKLALLSDALGVSLDASTPQKALVRCSGNSDIIFQYSDTSTCKGVAQRLRGFRKCPFACPGLGDCLTVCPQNAISIDRQKMVATVDWSLCTGCGLCVSECPQYIIELVPADTKIALLCSYTPLKNVPGRERCDSGCTHCKKCFRACEDDAIAWNEQILMPQFDPQKCSLCLKCAQQCPPDCLSQLAPQLAATK